MAGFGRPDQHPARGRHPRPDQYVIRHGYRTSATGGIESRSMPTTAPPSTEPTASAGSQALEPDVRMSFGDHLEELRACLIQALIGVVLTTIASLVFGKEILEIICWPLWSVQAANGLSPSLQVLSPMAAFAAYLKIGFLSGLILAMPWALYQLWRFIASGLYTHERRFMKLLMPISLGLFVVGVLFLYFVVLPIVLHFFIRFNQSFVVDAMSPGAFQQLLLADDSPTLSAEPMEKPAQVAIVQENPTDPRPGDVWVNALSRRLMVQTDGGALSIPLEPGLSANLMQSQFAIDFYISFVLLLALAFGVAFETPIVVFFLSWSGIISRQDMARGRRYVLFSSVVVSAIFTPPDVVSQLLLAVPIYLLFELGMLAARLTEKPSPADAAG